MGNSWKSWADYSKLDVVSCLVIHISSILNIFRPGPPETQTGASSTYFVPWKVSLVDFLYHIISIKSFLAKDHVPLSEKLDQILAWVDLPLEKRPQLIMGISVYLSTCDLY